MKFIKLFLISVIALFLVLTLMSALLPSQVRISRAVDINGSAADIEEQVFLLKNWNKWNRYVKDMPAGRLSVDSVRAGQLTISVIDRKTESIVTSWSQENGKNFTGVFNLINQGSVTTVQWYFEFRFKWYPWEKFSSIIYDAQVGPPMQESLLNLKGLIENVH